MGADRIAVGHTLDDQAETFLLKLMRGAGLTGLGGIYPRRDSVIRPLLEVTRCGAARATSRRPASAGLRTRPTKTSPTRAIGSVTASFPNSTWRQEDRLALPSRGRRRSFGRMRQWLDELSRRSLSRARGRNRLGNRARPPALAETPAADPAAGICLRRCESRRGAGRSASNTWSRLLALLGGLQGGIDVPGCRVELRGRKLVLIPGRGRCKVILLNPIHGGDLA